MHSKPANGRNITIRIVTGLFLSFFVTLCLYAEGTPRFKADTAAKKITITVGKSLILDTRENIKRVSIAEPGLADVVIISPRQIYITGKNPGLTNLTLWGNLDSAYRVFDIEVMPDVNRLKEKLHKMLPQEKDIKVTAGHDYLTLSGTVSNTETQSQVLEFASAFAPVNKEGKPKVMNLLQVGGVHQVMLEVRVSEMSRSLARRLGFNFTYITASGEQLGLSLLNNLTMLPDGGWPANPLEVTSNIAGIMRFLGNGTSWTVFIDALKDNGLIKILAEPTLITLSGKEAKFLAGGEYPIPVPQAGGGGVTITIQYRPYGVGLAFTPIVLNNGKISMTVAPEVSELDFATSVALQGYIVPSITTRRVSTTVELADGQSFAIAGLLKEETRESIRKYPILGDLPILGPLFRSSSYQKKETELIVIVTPHLVKPLDMVKQTLPTDQFVEPDDFEFYMLGRMEGSGVQGSQRPAAVPASPPVAAPSEIQIPEGKFGHAPPK